MHLKLQVLVIQSKPNSWAFDRKNRVVNLSVKAKDQADEKEALDKVNQADDAEFSTNAMAEAFKAAQSDD